MKPVVLTFIRHYLPGQRSGGPSQTIANMTERLGDEFEFRIVEMDRDLGDEQAYPNIRPGTWTQCGKAWVQYTSPTPFRLGNVADIVRATPPDVIYLNGFFDPRFTQPVLMNRRLGRFGGVPIVIAPRGELSESALRIKRFKKHAFIQLATLLQLYRNLHWQASSVFEARDIARRLSIALGGGQFGQITVAANIVVAPDLVGHRSESTSASTVEPARRPGVPLRVCFLSRISPMKNLDFALGVLSHVRVAVRFSIYGPIEDRRHWALCQKLIAVLPPHIEVGYKGQVDHHEVVPTLARHDLFLLPTRGENFGHVIHEALSAGLPLLISDRTPWRKLAEKGVGWELPLDDQAAFARRIEEMAGWSNADFHRVAAAASALSSRVVDDEESLDANRRLFIDAIGSRVRTW
jgi:glycosyltransferase involved in cell wall biosynthesis